MAQAHEELPHELRAEHGVETRRLDLGVHGEATVGSCSSITMLTRDGPQSAFELQGLCSPELIQQSV